MAKRHITNQRLLLPLVMILLLSVGILAVMPYVVSRKAATANLRQQHVVTEINLTPTKTQETIQPDFKTGSVFFIGNATVLIRYAGFTILTDPNFLHAGDHVHLGYGIQAKRLTNPAIDLEELPPIDLIVLSHMHGDHFDQLVEAKLNRNIPIITTPHAVARLKTLGFQALTGLNTWESAMLKKGSAALEITAMPGKHGPGPVAAALPQVHGSMLEFKKQDGQIPYRIYISGDTLVYDDLKKIPRQYPDINLGLFHLGGTRVLGITVTMDAKQGVKALQIIAPRKAIPIHYNDYDRFKSPLSDFQKAVIEAGLEDKVHYLKHGDTYRFQTASKN